MERRVDGVGEADRHWKAPLLAAAAGEGVAAEVGPAEAHIPEPKRAVGRRADKPPRVSGLQGEVPDGVGVALEGARQVLRRALVLGVEAHRSGGQVPDKDGAVEAARVGHARRDAELGAGRHVGMAAEGRPGLHVLQHLGPGGAVQLLFLRWALPSKARRYRPQLQGLVFRRRQHADATAASRVVPLHRDPPHGREVRSQGLPLVPEPAPARVCRGEDAAAAAAAAAARACWVPRGELVLPCHAVVGRHVLPRLAARGAAVGPRGRPEGRAVLQAAFARSVARLRGRLAVRVDAEVGSHGDHVLPAPRLAEGRRALGLGAVSGSGIARGLLLACGRLLGALRARCKPPPGEGSPRGGGLPLRGAASA
mmetsp:Transcript_24097/g.57392  ORF Transcript_24097/g.57392 Transcript_24097/m.57392 type:complete len:367 (+) Transcript_24097:706-1806(+)